MDAMELYELVKQDENDLELYLEECPEVMTRIDKNERSLLHWTVLSGRERLFEFIYKFLDSQKSLTKFINMEDDTKATLLILAVLGGNVDIVRRLLDFGEKIDHQNQQGHSPIQYACSKGRKEIVELLVERKANINIRDSRGDSCLHRLASTGRDDIMEILLKQCNLKVLDSQNSEGNTALHIACEDDNTACVNLLINTGADYKIENKEKKTIFDLCKIPLRRQLIEKLNLGTD